MFRLNTLAQAIKLALLQEGVIEAILNEVNGSNRSEGITIKSMGIRMNQNI